MNQQWAEQERINTDPREQRQEKIYERKGRTSGQNMRRNIRRGVFIVVLLIALSGIMTAWGLLSPRSFAALPTRSLQVGSHAQLVVKGTSGKIHIHAGNGNTIIIQGTRYASGVGSSVNDLGIDYTQQGDTVNVTTQEGWGLLGSRGVELDITVPASTDIKTNNLSGEVDVEDTTGKVEISTGSGGVHLTNVKGLATISTGSGGIDAKSMQLSGNSSLSSGSGGIQFQGTLDPQGSYHMDAGSGNITLTLPTDAAFQLQTSTLSGDVTNDFGKAAVGTTPQPTLSLKTLSGDIVIHRG